MSDVGKMITYAKKFEVFTYDYPILYDWSDDSVDGACTEIDWENLNALSNRSYALINENIDLLECMLHEIDPGLYYLLMFNEEENEWTD